MVTWNAGMHSMYLGLSWSIMQQRKVRPFSIKRSDSPLMISCDNKPGLALLQGVVLPGLWTYGVMKVFRLYLFSQCSQDDPFPGAWALTAQITLILLVSMYCYLLMYQACGEDVAFAKGTPSLRIIKYGKSFVPGCLCCGFPVCLSWWAFLSASLVFQAFPSLSPSVPWGWAQKL